MVTVRCTLCNVTFADQPSVEYANNQHSWYSDADHAPIWEKVD